MQLYDLCDAKGPRQGAEPIGEVVDLSPYSHEQLHLLMRCKGFMPRRNTSVIPSDAMTPALACAELPVYVGTRLWLSVMLCVLLVAVVLLCLRMFALRWLMYGSMASDRIPKDEDEGALPDFNTPGPSRLPPSRRRRGDEKAGGTESGEVEMV
eukprot:gnl/TRDRNA2_/TRDRNA2_84914_c0_seq2.p1 gnl/TRDRNA2_/TRDRNA2_84914_c0~~gnl/TRDRNA2_/TRDRNA2_84914_c0_seq2.p1  ORF type:complete len:153 (-),score=25.87 gnl/TRDRNA2_/TRDRNA2_84914_c0_seq2:205-663(-)